MDETTGEANVEVFSVVERDQKNRKDITRTYIYNIPQKYVIVLEPQVRSGNAYYLLTAYYLDEDYGEKQMKKKMKKGARTKSRDDSRRQSIHLASAVSSWVPLVEHFVGLCGPNVGRHRGLWVF